MDTCGELKTQIMKNNTTLYHFIVDRSSSMYNCVDETIGSFNRQLDTITQLQHDYPNMKFLQSVTLFNTEIDQVVSMESSVGEHRLNRRNFVPAGSTALLDAIGISLQRIERVLGQEIEEDKASVVVVILTDGEENSSRMFNHKEVSSMISRLSSTGKWTFNFLGADLESFDVVDSLSIPRQNAKLFSKAEFNATMVKMDDSVRQYARMKSEGDISDNLIDF